MHESTLLLTRIRNSQRYIERLVCLHSLQTPKQNRTRSAVYCLPSVPKLTTFAVTLLSLAVGIPRQPLHHDPSCSGLAPRSTTSPHCSLGRSLITQNSLLPLFLR